MNATARRLRRAADLGARLLAAFAAGNTGAALARLLNGEPHDLIIRLDGRDWRLRLYGIETPPCRSETAAIITWARMATGTEAMEDTTAHSPTGQ